MFSEFYKPTYTMDKIWVKDLNISADFVLGLDFYYIIKEALL